MAVSPQPALELILARNLISSLTTPAMLVDAPGDVLFFNEAAGALLGRRFEETGRMSASDWTSTFGPLDETGEPIPLDEQPLTKALRKGRPGHAEHRIRSVGGAEHDIKVSGLPIIGSDGFQGAMIFFWQVG